MRKAFCTVEDAVLQLDSLELTGAKDLTSSDTVAMFTETCKVWEATCTFCLKVVGWGCN